MASKFAAYANKFNTIRDNIKKKREEEERSKGGGTYDDSYKFKPSLPPNKTKITYRLRILPNVHSELGEPWLLGYFHMFRRADGKFIYSLCPKTTLGNDAPCPMCEKAKKLFSTQDQMDADEARNIYKKKRYFANVLVVEDPRSGEEKQEGKVLVWEFGSQVYDKLDEAIDRGINFFHPTEGRDFELQIKKKGEYQDYNSSTFSLESTPISEDEDEMDGYFENIYNLEKKVFGNGPKEYSKLLEMLTGQESDESNSKKVDRVLDSDSNDDDDDDDISETFDDSDDDSDDSDDEVKSSVSNDDDDDDFDFDFSDD